MDKLRSPYVAAIVIGLFAGTSVGVSAQEPERVAPVEVTGTELEGPCPGGSSRMVDFVEQNRDYTCKSLNGMSACSLKQRPTSITTAIKVVEHHLIEARKGGARKGVRKNYSPSSAASLRGSCRAGLYRFWCRFSSARCGGPADLRRDAYPTGTMLTR